MRPNVIIIIIVIYTYILFGFKTGTYSIGLDVIASKFKLKNLEKVIIYIMDL